MSKLILHVNAFSLVAWVYLPWLIAAYEANIYGFNSNSEMVQNGKVQYQLLQERSGLPKYGSCWQQSVAHVEDGCRQLSEETQSDIALHLTNCFLEMSGLPSYECITDRKPNLRRICISSMTDRAFNVYTEFYTHTQNMCWFLRGQIWHEAIDRSTQLVGEQLTTSTEQQRELIAQQRASLLLQEKLLSYGNDLQDMLERFHVSSQQHAHLLSRMSGTLVQLQNWLIGEISWFDTICFYAFIAFMTGFITASQRTASARFPLIVLLSATIFAERLICQLSSIDSATMGHSDLGEAHRSYYSHVWSLRYAMIAVFAVIVVYVAVTYRDQLQHNNVLIVKLSQQLSDFITKSQLVHQHHHSPVKRRSILNVENERRSLDNAANILKPISSTHNNDNGYSTDVSLSSRSETPLYTTETVSPNVPAAVMSLNRVRMHSPPVISLRYNLRRQRATPDTSIN